MCNVIVMPGKPTGMEELIVKKQQYLALVK
jgi:hypothetical protein